MTMDIENFIKLSLDDQVVQLRGELGLLQALWAREGAFGRVWTRVLDLLISRPTEVISTRRPARWQTPHTSSWSRDRPTSCP